MANIWQDFFNAMAERWEKLKLQMIFHNFEVASSDENHLSDEKHWLRLM